MNKKLMRFAALLLAAAMLFSFSACRTNDDGSESSTDEPSVTDAGNIHEESTDSAELTTDEPTTDSRTVTRSNVPAEQRPRLSTSTRGSTPRTLRG